MLNHPLVGIIMGSISDYETLQFAEQQLKELEISYEIEVVSAHRTPDRMFSYAKQAVERGLKVIIAGAGGAAHLPGMVSALTTLPVLGVPVQSKVLNGVDSLLSIVQMPAGIPTATFAIGKAGASNAALFAAQILALNDQELQTKLEKYRQANADKVRESNLKLSSTNNPLNPPRTPWYESEYSVAVSLVRCLHPHCKS
jgi:5-(carboxyamino)imidazole ribonucleotide mutase